ncbi:MAG: polyphosphate kinase 1 [Elainellaceae cyanobacterium]
MTYKPAVAIGSPIADVTLELAHGVFGNLPDGDIVPPISVRRCCPQLLLRSSVLSLATRPVTVIVMSHSSDTDSNRPKAAPKTRRSKSQPDVEVKADDVTIESQQQPLEQPESVKEPDKPLSKANAPQDKPTSPSTAKSATDGPDFFFNRELSWLAFNYRVLYEALDDRTLLLERLKFMAIVSSNLDEFFMVRVAGLMQQVEAGVETITPDGRSPQQQLDDIGDQLHPAIAQQHECFEQVLRPMLTEHGVFLLSYSDITDQQARYLEQHFEEQIFPVLTPLAVDPGHPFPYISNLSLNLAVLMRDPETDAERFARVKVPPSRFVTLPSELCKHLAAETPLVWAGIPLEEVIAHNLEVLFRGMEIQQHCFFRITRNADIDVEEDEADDLLLAIEKELRKRRLGRSAVRLEIQADAPEFVRETLIRELELPESSIYSIHGMIGLGHLMSLTRLPLPDLKEQPWQPVIPSRLQHDGSLFEERDAEDSHSLFSEMRQRDLMVHHPYHSFTATVQRFVTQAAIDPDVLAIKMTLYRTSGDSPIVNALIRAAEHGKQVVALVELKARFDEENNIVWARELERSGVHVVYGLVGLKTHTKITLVVRKKGDRIRRYVHIGTGNYNPKTAKFYTDLGLFTCNEEIGADLSELFNHLTGYSRQDQYRKLLVAPVSLRCRMLASIEQETSHAQSGKPAKIQAKMNSLVDPEIIRALYRASQAGVEIDLVVRGICCLRPGVEGLSETIRVVSVVGRFLEHSRIFYFYDDGAEQMYLGSADWMPRNLDRRVEAVTPVEDRGVADKLKQVMTIMLEDNRHAWDLQPDGTYQQRKPGKGKPVRSSQDVFMTLALAGKLN